MADPRLNQLLQWGVQNSAAARDDAAAPPPSSLTPDVLAALLGGPSDADRMREAMRAVTSDDVDLENKLTALDNFEQLLEHIDNANNLEPLGLWTPLLQLLQSNEADIRRMAAWCVGTAVQNNVKAQEKLLQHNAIPTLAKMAVDDPSQGVRKKAINALSSAARNYQLGLDAAVDGLPGEHKIDKPLDAASMDDVDLVINKLRDHSAQKA